MPEGLKIIELRAENVKRIKAVSIRPATNLVEIVGRNGQGKSSVLDAIWWALSGTSHIQAVPIRKGATEALIKLDLGNVKITRTFRAKDEGGEYTTSLVVENGDGARFPSPQTMLDRLVGQLSFDPLAFARMHAKEQFEALKRFVPGFDFDADKKAYDEIFKERTEATREAKTLRTQAGAILEPKDAPDERVDESGLVLELEEAGRQNTEIERRRAGREQAAQNLRAHEGAAASHRSRAEELRAQAEEEDRQAGEAAAAAAALREKIATAGPLPDPISTSDVRQKIEAARASNAMFDRAQDARRTRASAEERAATADGRVAELTTTLEKRRTDRQAAIASATMPVPSLSFGDGEILLDGLPFEQASDAERLRASIAIAMASNPRLRVIRVRDGSLLDADAMRLLQEMADDSDYQVWVERVGGDGKIGFIIEDGSLANGAVDVLAAAE